MLIPYATADSSFYKRGSQMLWSVVYRTEKKGRNLWSKHEHKTRLRKKILKEKMEKKNPKNIYDATLNLHEKNPLCSSTDKKK